VVLWSFVNTTQAQVVVNFTTAGTTNFTVPNCVYTISVECVGGGGNGGGRSSSTGSCGGGGGGAYASSVLSVLPGQIYSYTVGNTSGTSSFGTGPTLVSAVGGTGVANNTTTGGAGGLASASPACKPAGFNQGWHLSASAKTLRRRFTSA
jgi:MSHA biogenesis protein MshQ